ncbi:hypothetical protein BGZ54_005359, partial [Gamsiella multidivaricata]
LSSDASHTILDSPQAQRRHVAYGPTQQVYIRWAQERDEDPFHPDPALLINYLAHQRRTRDWKPTTVLAKRSTILDLFSDRSPITESMVYKDYIAALKATDIKPAEIGCLDISPALAYLQSLPNNDDMALVQLTRKLCWLLDICSFLRADDIHCVDINKTTFDKRYLKLFVLLPKERRKGKRIEKVVYISANSDPKLCPLAAYQFYTSRIKDHPVTVPHPKDKNFTICPFIRNTLRLHAAVSMQTISNHMDSISTLIPEVERPTRRVKPRAIGSTIAAES